MTTDPEPITRRAIWCVRWTKWHWSPDADGYRRWKSAYRVQPDAALDLAHKLKQAGALVVIDLHRVASTVRVPLEEPPVPDDAPEPPPDREHLAPIEGVF